MKRFLRLLCWYLLCAGMLSGCTEAVEPTGIEMGKSFYTSVQGFTFYFLDENGNDRISIEDTSTWPLTFSRQVAASDRPAAFANVKSQPDATGRLVYQYNDFFNSLSFDESEGLWGFRTYFWGRTSQPQFLMYLYLGDVVSKLVVSYQYYNNGGQVPLDGNSWGAAITSITYDGPGVSKLEILSGNKNWKVFIHRPSSGNDVVTLEQR